MKIKLTVIAATFLFFACAEKKSNTTVNGEIQGLKKGVLYLEKIEDSLMTTIDSLSLNGQSEFSFSLNLESPEVLYLFLRKTEGIDIEDGIEFFAEPGNIEVNTSLKEFEGAAQISGSSNHDKLLEYHKLMQRFNDRSLELFAENIEAEKAQDDSLKAKVHQQYESLVKSKYIASINFVINNKDFEVSPYITLSEIFDANIKYLDTIYYSLTPKVKESNYGKQLEGFIAERKKLESNE